MYGLFEEQVKNKKVFFFMVDEALRHPSVSAVVFDKCFLLAYSSR